MNGNDAVPPLVDRRGASPRRALNCVIAIVLVAVAACIDVPVPGSPVPQSLQTLAVVLVGMALGARGGTLAMLGYLAAGAVGVPVFADGAAGWRHLFGPTAGYLAGFVAAAALVGWLAERRYLERFLPALATMLAAHAVILALGWLRLAALVGPAVAYDRGVAPFLIGGAAKSLVAALMAVAWTRYRPRAEAVA